jgi:hypothetical protein
MITSLKFSKYLYLFFLTFTTYTNASLSYRCEHQASQNAVQFPLENYFYIIYDKPKIFESYKVLNYSENKLTSLLEYDKGRTRDSSYLNSQTVVTDWGEFFKKFNAFKMNLDKLITPDSSINYNLEQNLNIDFLSQVNEPSLFHSLQLTKYSTLNSNQVSFQFLRPDTEIEKKTILPAHKIDYKIANKNILFNESTGMLMQVEIKVNTAFLRYVFVCRSWELEKIPAVTQPVDFKKIDGNLVQFELKENDKAQSKGQFSSLVYELIFRKLAEIYKLKAPDNKEKLDINIKIVHSLAKSRVLRDYIVRMLKINSSEIIKSDLKKQLLIYSRHRLSNEHAGLSTDVLAQIYSDMFNILVSYSQITAKGFK